MGEIFDICKELIEKGGDKVMVHTPECTKFKKESGADNCVNCKYNLGCGKVVRLQLAIICSNSRNQKLVHDTIKEILAAKTIEDLRAISDIEYDPDPREVVK